MSAADPPPGGEPATPLGAPAAAELLLPGLSSAEKVLIAVSGGPDSLALLTLAAEVRASCPPGRGTLLCATVDHALRPESADEARAVAAACARLQVPHHILRWTGEKPRSGLQAAARAARYALLLDLARREGAEILALAHTLDDQAETVLFRLMRGSGVTGLAGMQVDVRRDGIRLWRPFLAVPKARLVATLEARGIGFFRDPSNADPRFARPRLRRLAPLLAAEGLDAARFAVLARRMARADAALEAATDAAQATCAQAWPEGGEEGGETAAGIILSAADFAALPQEIALRLLLRAVTRVGHEGPAELGKLEALADALRAALGKADAEVRHSVASCATGAFRRTLAGALVSLSGREIRVEAAPPRRKTPPAAVNRRHEPAPSLAKVGGGPKLAAGRFDR